MKNITSLTLSASQVVSHLGAASTVHDSAKIANAFDGKEVSDTDLTIVIHRASLTVRYHNVIALNAGTAVGGWHESVLTG